MCGMGAKDAFEWKEMVREYEGDGYHFELPVTLPFCGKCGAPIYDEETERQIARKANKEIHRPRAIEIPYVAYLKLAPKVDANPLRERLKQWSYGQDPALTSRYVEKWSEKFPELDTGRGSHDLGYAIMLMDAYFSTNPKPETISMGTVEFPNRNPMGETGRSSVQDVQLVPEGDGSILEIHYTVSHDAASVFLSLMRMHPEIQSVENICEETGQGEGSEWDY